MRRIKRLFSTLLLIISLTIIPPFFLPIAATAQGEPRGGIVDRARECIEVIVIGSFILIWDTCTGEILFLGY
ncbi:MAG: hypothetical protein KF868_12540 [Acidobacteria bacterium]|nr:hypothetical protein [Acidobacteriota bacterium]MCW5968690.1 hypothetical protein [Blastocatellales bacterium]